MRKVSLYILTAVIALAFASCNTDAEKAFYESKGGIDAGFPSKVLVRDLASAENGTFAVKVYRATTKGAASIPVTLTSVTSVVGTTRTPVTGLFSLQTATADFAAGEAETTINVLYTFGSLNPVPTYEIVLDLNEDDASPAAFKTLTIRAKMKLEYASIGTGTFRSVFYRETGTPYAEWEVDVHKAQGVDAYIIKDCYEPGYDIKYIISAGEVIVETQNIGWYYNDTYKWVMFTPQSSVIVDGGVDFTVRFTLTGAAFGGTFLEQIRLP